MSEYQYYEFRTIDRPLTDQEQANIGRLSSRVDLSPYHAIFVYNYSDLPTSAKDLLTQYFDAMFYIANWGSCQLMFRFPKDVIEYDRVQAYFHPYLIEEFLSVRVRGEYVILNIEWHQEDSGWGWIEGEGRLARLLPLRDDLLRGDYRLLYLAWLKAISLEDMLPSVLEPPVPPGLRQLSPPLKAFVELFELDQNLVAAAAEASGLPSSISEAQIRQAISRMPGAAQAEWLFRLAQGQPQLSAAFNQALLKLLDLPAATATKRRSIGDLLAGAERVRREVRTNQIEEEKARHLEKMVVLAAQKDRIWQETIDLIGQKTGRSYDQAVANLSDLHDLARYQQEEARFQEQVNTIFREYRQRPALLRRLQKAGLYEL